MSELGGVVRPRVGVVLPSVQVVTEPLFARAAGADFDFVATRVALEGTSTADLEAMESRLPRAIDDLAAARVDLLVSCCAASGALRGREADERACAEVSSRTGIPMTTTMLSIVARLRELRVRRLTVVTPYPPELDEVEHRYLSDNGFTVTAAAGQGIVDGFEISCSTTAGIVDLARRTWHPDSDALLLSCMNWPTHEAVSMLERMLGVPVVSSHGATLWNIRRMLTVGVRKTPHRAED